MPQLPQRQANTKPTAAPCLECQYWKPAALDALMELASARELLAQVDEDLVELVAAKRFQFYSQLGGSTLTPGAFRAKVRHELCSGEHIR